MLPEMPKNITRNGCGSCGNGSPSASAKSCRYSHVVGWLAALISRVVAMLGMVAGRFQPFVELEGALPAQGTAGRTPSAGIRASSFI